MEVLGISEVENLGWLWKGRFITDGIFVNFLSNEGMLEQESLSENLVEVDLLKDSFTLPYEYWVTFCNSVFGSSCFGITRAVAPSRIHSSGRLTSFHWIGFGMTVLALDKSVCKRRVSSLFYWNLCCVLNAEIMVL